MAFSDPQSITVNLVAQSLPRIDSPQGRSEYRKDDGSYLLTLGRTFGAKRNSFRIRVDHTKLVTDPFVAANNIRVGATAYIVLDMPTLGYTNAEIKDIALGLTGWSTSGNLLKVLGGET